MRRNSLLEQDTRELHASYQIITINQIQANTSNNCNNSNKYNNYRWPVTFVYFRRRSLRRKVSFLAANPILPRVDSTHSLYLRRIAFKKAIINLMYRVAHIHQVDTEMRNEPKCVEKKMCPRLFALRLVVDCTWMHWSLHPKDKYFIINYCYYLSYCDYLHYWIPGPGRTLRPSESHFTTHLSRAPFRCAPAAAASTLSRMRFDDLAWAGASDTR